VALWARYARDALRWAGARSASPASPNQDLENDPARR